MEELLVRCLEPRRATRAESLELWEGFRISYEQSGLVREQVAGVMYLILLAQTQDAFSNNNPSVLPHKLRLRVRNLAFGVGRQFT